jgi:hypothetical protein
MSPPVRSSGLALLGLLASAGACVRAEFVRTDAAFRPHPPTHPTVFIDHLPERAYRAVGVIEVSGPPAHMDLVTVMEEARNAGSEAGCDVVVDRSIHRVSLADPARPRVLLAQFTPSPRPYTPPPSFTTPVYTPPPDRRAFICGVYVAAPPGPPPAPAPAAVPGGAAT